MRSPTPPLDSLAGPDTGDDREEYPTPRGRAGRVGTSSQRAGGAASRHEDGGEWTREPTIGPIEGGDHVSPKTGGTAEGPTFRPGWTVGHIAGAARTVHQVAPSSTDTAQADARRRWSRGESLSRDPGARRSWARCSTARSRRPSWVACSWPSACGPRRPTSWPASWRRCARGCWWSTHPQGTIDTCGTGGDVHGTFNISTATSLVTAAAGVPIAKHGNRAVTSQSGSSDAIASLGLTVEQTPEAAEASLRETGYAYLHAPAFHPGMRHAGPVRRELGRAHGVQPVRADGQPGARHAAADGRARRGVRRACRTRAPRARHRAGVRGPRRHDRRAAARRQRGLLRRHARGRPPAHGRPPRTPACRRAETSALAGGDGAANAAIIRAILDGTEHGARHDVVALNAGAALVVAGRVDTIRQGVELAVETIRSGAAAELLARLQARAWSPEQTGDQAMTMTIERPRPARARPVRAARDRRAATRGPRRGARRHHPAGAGPGGRGRSRPAVRRAPPRAAGAASHRGDQAPLPVGGVAQRRAAGRRRPGTRLRRGRRLDRSRCSSSRTGSGARIDDLVAARAATSMPVLAKEFVVDPRQLPILRAAGADAVLLLAALHPAPRLARLVRRALDLGLEPLVEVHDARELDAALATDARLIGVNNRDLRTLVVDTDDRRDAPDRHPRRPPRRRRVRRPRAGAAAPLAGPRLRRRARRRGPDARRLGPRRP